MHAVLGAIALRSWVQTAKPQRWIPEPQTTSGRVTPLSRVSKPSPNLAPTYNKGIFVRRLPLSTARHFLSPKLLPWFFLAAIFAIPGVYLEWPSDPWEHLHRISEWNTHLRVGFHSVGYKTSYFFAYSFVGWLSPSHLVQWLNVYYVGICLLLAWQYFLLAKAVGLDRRWSFVFVLINALAFGNSSFSFYRYYGISSSIFAQLGAIALTRIALETAMNSRSSIRSFFGPGIFRNRSGEPFLDQSPRSTIYGLLISVPPLLVLTSLNHVQGIGIAGLSIGSIVVWRCIQWKRSMIFWVAIAALVLSAATILWWPRGTAVDSVYRLQGWLNPWYGLNFLSGSSLAADRAVLIFGSFGLLNLSAGLYLLVRNQSAGWLTLGPLIGLSLPCVAIPLTSKIAAANPGEIVAFHRMFFAVPSGLAIVVLAQICFAPAGSRVTATLRSLFIRFTDSRARAHIVFALSISCLSIIVVVPTSGPYFNRAWSLLSRTPDDLKLLPIWKGTEAWQNSAETPSARRIIAMSLPGYIVDLQQIGYPFVAYRHYARSERSPNDDLSALTAFIGDKARESATHVLLVDPFLFISPYSFAAVCSMHWPAQEVALAAVGTPELEKLSTKAGRPSAPISGGTLFLTTRSEKERASSKP